MDPGGVILILFLFICGCIAVGFIGYFVHLQQKKRREALAALATGLGWRFNPSRDKSHDDRYSQFPVFRQGHSRFAYNMITGQMTVDGRTMPVRMGDYHYQVTTNDGKNTSTQTYVFSYVLFELPFLGDQDLFIRTEGFFDKMAAFVGFDDIDFESVRFSDRFHVKSSDKKFAYDIVHPRMMEFLFSSNPPTIHLEERCCCLYENGKTLDPEDFRAMLRWAQQFFEQWPDYVTAAFER